MNSQFFGGNKLKKIYHVMAWPFRATVPKPYGKRLFLMDNDPSQTSKQAMLALTEIESDLH